MKEFGPSSQASFGSFIVDSRGTILGFDQEMERLTGWPATEVVGRGKELDLAGSGAILTVSLFEGRIPVDETPENTELTLFCRDGRRLDVEASARPLNGPRDRMLVTVQRVLASSARGNRLPSEHRVDSLTGLANRHAFAAGLEVAFLEASSRSRPLSLILLDIDHLRNINDRMSYGVGDAVLCKLAQILRTEANEESRIARLGDDDFAILLADGGRGEARQLAAALRSIVERTRFFEEDGPLEQPLVTISVGTASFPADADTQSELIERAREALDEARSMGRNRVWCYLRRPRVPVQVPVYFDGTDPLLLGYTRDLSPSGIFLQTTAGIDVGMRCALTFPLPGHDGKVHVVGRVVRTVHPQLEANEESLRVPGLGVEFERFGGASDRRAIETFLHGREDQSLRPENGILSV